MNKNKTLKQKIVQSVFLYETRQMTIETIIKTVILFISFAIILVFGGVIADIIIENELISALKDLIIAHGYSLSRLLEWGGLMGEEVPVWLLFWLAFGLLVGCILMVSFIRNWKRIVHKVRSLVSYWFTI